MPPLYGQRLEISLMLMSSYPIQCHYIPRVDEHMQKISFPTIFLDTQNVRALRRFTLVQAFSEMLTMCLSQLQVFEKVSP